MGLGKGHRHLGQQDLYRYSAERNVYRLRKEPTIFPESKNLEADLNKEVFSNFCWSCFHSFRKSDSEMERQIAAREGCAISIIVESACFLPKTPSTRAVDFLRSVVFRSKASEN